MFGIFNDNNKKNVAPGNISEWSYQRYCQFLGYDLLGDPNFDDKIDAIYEQVNTYNEEKIEKIAEKSGCTVSECILKLKYLKNKRWIDSSYYINVATKEIKKCTEQDLNLLNKYYEMVYLKEYQVKEMLIDLKKEDETITDTDIFSELKYLCNNSLLNGIILDEDNKEIVYYTKEKRKKASFLVTLKCPNCGALVDVPKFNSGKCGYCNTIVEDTYSEKVNNNGNF